MNSHLLEPSPGGLGRKGRQGRYLRLGRLQGPRWCLWLHRTVEGLDVLWGVEACWAVVLSSDHSGGRSCGSSEGHRAPVVCTSYVPYFLHAKEQRQKSEVLRRAGGVWWGRPERVATATVAFACGVSWGAHDHDHQSRWAPSHTSWGSLAPSWMASDWPSGHFRVDMPGTRELRNTARAISSRCHSPGSSCKPMVSHRTYLLMQDYRF